MTDKCKLTIQDLAAILYHEIFAHPFTLSNTAFPLTLHIVQVIIFDKMRKGKFSVPTSIIKYIDDGNNNDDVKGRNLKERFRYKKFLKI